MCSLLSIRHPWRLAYTVWGRTIALGTVPYVAFFAVTAGLEAAAESAAAGVVAALVSVPSVFILRYALPLILRFDSRFQRVFLLISLVAGLFLGHVLPLCYLATVHLFDIHAFSALEKWLYIMSSTAVALPYLLAALLVTLYSCRRPVPATYPESEAPTSD